MQKNTVLTTSFRLSPEDCGEVYLYRGNTDFHNAWQRLTDRVKANSRTNGWFQLPYVHLLTDLRHRSGDFVSFYPRPGRVNAEWTVFVSRQPLDEFLPSAFQVWEHLLPGNNAEPSLAPIIGEIAAEPEKVQICDRIIYRNGQVPTTAPADGWVWSAALWNIVHRLAEEPLQLSDRQVKLTPFLDVMAGFPGLVTWDSPVQSRGDRPAMAMHSIEPRMITQPGSESPIVHLQTRLSRIANFWGRTVKSAWVDLGDDRPLLQLPIGFKGKRIWGRVEVLEHTQFKLLPGLSPERPAEIPNVRPRFETAPPYFPIGKGSGQKVHEAVARHARRLLPASRPLEMSRVERSLPRPVSGGISGTALRSTLETIDRDRLLLVCLYASEQIRKRLVDALKSQFDLSEESSWPPPNGVIFEHGKLDVLFVSPNDAASMLCKKGDAVLIRKWLADNIPKETKPKKNLVGFLVETLPADARDGDGDDPKFIIRRELADKGIVTQFIAAVPDESHKPKKDSTDHGAVNAVADLLRACGVFPDPFPTVKQEIPQGTWIIGLHAVRRTGRTSFSNSQPRNIAYALVATKAGTRRCLGFTPDLGWVPFHQTVVAFLASSPLTTTAAARDSIDSALGTLLASDPDGQAVLFVDDAQCKYFWNGLQDKGGESLPRAVATGRLGVVRVRTERSLIPQPASTRGWESDMAGPEYGVDGLFELDVPDHAGVRYFISKSATMDQMGPHRDKTRYEVVENHRQLSSDWHGMGITEFWCCTPGPFESDSLYKLAATLCRLPSSWTRSTRRPGPHHLAFTVLADQVPE